MNKTTRIDNVIFNYPKVSNPFGTEVFDVQLELTPEQEKIVSELNLKVRDAGDKRVTNVTRKTHNAKGEPTPVRIVDASKQAFDKQIGNGTTGNVLLYTYEWSNNGRKGVKTIVTAIQVINHVEYTGSVDFDEVDSDF